MSRKPLVFLCMFLFSVLKSAVLFALPSDVFFSKENIISPVEGVWANPQPLIIDSPAGYEIYYSFTSEDPLLSGLAYDGPVINEQGGNVNLSIVIFDKDGRRNDIKINYSVQSKKNQSGNSESIRFLRGITNNPIPKVKAGSHFTIPSDLKYCLGKNTKSELPGTSITVSPNNKLNRYVPCIVTDGNSSWRFVINSTADNSSEEVENEVPFTFTDWEKFEYTGEKIIYQIDDGLWNASRDAVYLDRSVPHIIRWQSVAYEFGNPVSVMDVPVKPVLQSTKHPNRIFSFSIPENPLFQLRASGKKRLSGYIADGIYSEIQIDAFDGDEVKGSEDFSVYYDGVYQGKLSAEYSVDRQPPESPEFISSAKGTFVHDKVTLTIQKQSDAEIYYAVSDPLTSRKGFEDATRDTFNNVQPGRYKLYDNKKLILKSKDDLSTFYKVNAYAVDAEGNKSAVSEYRVAIDEFNFYLSQTALNQNIISEENVTGSDGSYGNPFRSFSQAVDAINKAKYSRLHIIGDLALGNGPVEITSSCSIIGNKTHLTLPEYATVNIRNAKVDFEGCIFEKEVPASAANKYLTSQGNEAIRHVIQAEASEISFRDCEIIGMFTTEGIVLYADASSVNLENCGLTSKASSYSCAVSANRCDIRIQNTRITTIAPTTVCMSVHEGSALIEVSSCTVIGHLGRIAEFINTNAKMNYNSFIGTLDENHPSVDAVWKDVNSDVLLTGNRIKGFE